MKHVAEFLRGTAAQDSFLTTAELDGESLDLAL